MNDDDRPRDDFVWPRGLIRAAVVVVILLTLAGAVLIGWLAAGMAR